MLGRLLDRLQGTAANRGRDRSVATPPTAVLQRAAEFQASGFLGQAFRVLVELHQGGDRSAGLRLRLAGMLIEWGRVREAAIVLDELRLDPEALEAEELAACGRLLLDLNRPVDALGCLEAALQAGWSDARRGVCLALQRASRLDEALDHCALLLEANPDDLLTLQIETQCHIDRKDLDAAEASVYRLLARHPDDAVGLFDLGIVMRGREQHQKAADAFALAAVRAPARIPHGGALDLALAYDTVGRQADAIEVLCNALPLHPTPEIHRTLGQALICAGDHDRGWREHEFRWFMEPLLSTRARGGMRPWEGQDLRGKTVLLRVEQGVGDTIQFMRYAPLLKARGARVIFSAMDLARCYAGVDGLLGEDCGIDEIDYYVNLMSLPLVFRTRRDSVPATVPYLTPLEEDRIRWQARIPRDGARNIALVWAGNPGHPADHERSMDLALLKPLLGLPGCRFFSLQKGRTSDATRRILSTHGVIDFEPSLTTFRDTAAVVEHMDLVVTVDTSVAHLAGAMARPVWVMLATPAEWRWERAGDATPWYPTMRLFRQPIPGDWAGVVREVADQLSSGEITPHGGESRDHTALDAGRDAACADHRSTGAVVNQRDVLLQYIPADGNRGRSLEMYGEYLQPWLEFLLRVDLRGATLLDLDAGYGEHVVPLARHLADGGTIIAVARDERGRTLLRQNLQANGVANVSVLTRGIVPAPAIDADTIDDLCLPRAGAWIKFGIDTPIRDVLSGAGDTLWRSRPHLAGVVADPPAGAALCSHLALHGYRSSTRSLALFSPANATRSSVDCFPGVHVTAVVAFPEEAPDPVVADVRRDFGLVDA